MRIEPFVLLVIVSLVLSSCRTSYDRERADGEAYEVDFVGYIVLGSTSGMQYVMEKGVDVNATNHLGKTGLHYAVSHAPVDVLRLLLENGANPNIADRDGNTPIFMACLYRRPDCVDMLLKAGATLDGRNRLGESLLDQLSKKIEWLTKPQWAKGINCDKAERDIRKLLMGGVK